MILRERMKQPYLLLHFTCPEEYNFASTLPPSRTTSVLRFELKTQLQTPQDMQHIKQLLDNLDGVLSFTLHSDFTDRRFASNLIHTFQDWFRRRGDILQEVRWFSEFADVLPIVRGKPDLEILVVHAHVEITALRPPSYDAMKNSPMQWLSLHTLHIIIGGGGSLHFLDAISNDALPQLKALFVDGVGSIVGFSNFVASLPCIHSIYFSYLITVTDIPSIPTLQRLSIPWISFFSLHVGALPSLTHLLLDFTIGDNVTALFNLQQLCDALFWTSQKLEAVDDCLPAIEFVTLLGWPKDAALNTRWTTSAYEAFRIMDLTCFMLGATLIDSQGDFIGDPRLRPVPDHTITEH